MIFMPVNAKNVLMIPSLNETAITKFLTLLEKEQFLFICEREIHNDSEKIILESRASKI